MLVFRTHLFQRRYRNLACYTPTCTIGPGFPGGVKLRLPAYLSGLYFVRSLKDNLVGMNVKHPTEDREQRTATRPVGLAGL